MRLIGEGCSSAVFGIIGGISLALGLTTLAVGNTGYSTFFFVVAGVMFLVALI